MFLFLTVSVDCVAWIALSRVFEIRCLVSFLLRKETTDMRSYLESHRHGGIDM